MPRPLCVALLVMLAITAPAAAQDYPARPITIVVPFAAGGPIDALARLMAQRMNGELGQPVIVENVAGAAGSAGVSRVYRAAADGYTIGIGNWGTHVLNGAFYRLQYDLINDFEPIALLPSNPMLIISRNGVPAKTLGELVAWLKANPGKVSAGTSGAGSNSHVTGAYFRNITGTDFQFVPYRSANLVIQDLMSGQIDITFDQASSSLPHVKAGSVRAYAVTSKARLAAAPEIPTVDEAGVPGLYTSVWAGFWAPKGTPKHAIARLNSAAVAALADPQLQQKLRNLGLEIPPPELQTPEALGSLQKAEIKKWWPLINAAGIKAE